MLEKHIRPGRLLALAIFLAFAVPTLFDGVAFANPPPPLPGPSPMPELSSESGIAGITLVIGGLLLVFDWRRNRRRKDEDK